MAILRRLVEQPLRESGCDDHSLWGRLHGKLRFLSRGHGVVFPVQSIKVVTEFKGHLRYTVSRHRVHPDACKAPEHCSYRTVLSLDGFFLARAMNYSTGLSPDRRNSRSEIINRFYRC